MTYFKIETYALIKSCTVDESYEFTEMCAQFVASHYFEWYFDSSLMPQVFNIPKVEHDQPCSTLVVIVFQISLFIYIILSPDWSMAKDKVNKQTNMQKQ